MSSGSTFQMPRLNNAVDRLPHGYMESYERSFTISDLVIILLSIAALCLIFYFIRKVLLARKKPVPQSSIIFQSYVEAEQLGYLADMSKHAKHYISTVLDTSLISAEAAEIPNLLQGTKTTVGYRKRVSQTFEDLEHILYGPPSLVSEQSEDAQKKIKKQLSSIMDETKDYLNVQKKDVKLGRLPQ